MDSCGDGTLNGAWTEVGGGDLVSLGGEAVGLGSYTAGTIENGSSWLDALTPEERGEDICLTPHCCDPVVENQLVLVGELIVEAQCGVHTRDYRRVARVKAGSCGKPLAPDGGIAVREECGGGSIQVHPRSNAIQSGS
ncbi:hypothetical protein GCM10008955_42210 [Deinococcus malanensis]|uniref:Uncharacterized protein n=1 Tax=Deinococcus malanensis TaxID=1706855 RepID=A0ABQ2F2P1_9DEIO|nr:hypothetical protein GCM10008955_42210 [Deinococcus malanensis]